MTVPCAILEDVYGTDWKRKKLKPTPQRQQEEQIKQNQVTQLEQNRINHYDPQGGKLKCPTCNNCIEKNNWFQQQVVNQAIDPRAQWIPQYANMPPPNVNAHLPQGSAPPYGGGHPVMGNPFNRYYNPNTTGRMVEGFANRENFGMSVSKGEKALQLILFILVALFVIQLFELIFSLF